MKKNFFNAVDMGSFDEKRSLILLNGLKCANVQIKGSKIWISIMGMKEVEKLLY